MKPYNVLKTKNALVMCVFYVTKNAIDSIVIMIHYVFCKVGTKFLTII
jgi:hypothetical protein